MTQEKPTDLPDFHPDRINQKTKKGLEELALKREVETVLQKAKEGDPVAQIARRKLKQSSS